MSYSTPPPAGQNPQYGAPQPGIPQQNPAADRLVLNYWLSVFFQWIPALIFFFLDRGKDARQDSFNRKNLIFSLVRTAVGVVASSLTLPALLNGETSAFGSLLGLVGTVLFVFHIVASISVKERYNTGGEPNFVIPIK